MPQMRPPAMVAHRTGRMPRFRRYPVPIWTNDSKITKNENSQKTGAGLQLWAAASEPDRAPHVYSSRPASIIATQAAMMATVRGYPRMSFGSSPMRKTRPVALTISLTGLPPAPTSVRSDTATADVVVGLMSAILCLTSLYPTQYPTRKTYAAALKRQGP